MLKRMKKQTANRPKKIAQKNTHEYDKLVETRYSSSHHASSRRRYSSDYHDDRANYLHRHIRDGLF